MNFLKDSIAYKMISHSYFPGEGDESANLKPVFLEDEIWTKIRLGSEFLPVGELEILPSAFYQRLLHRPHQAVKAFAILKKDNAVSGEMIYSVEYTEPARKLEIHFQEKFPFIIQGWEETYQDGFGSEAPVLTTRATRLNTEMLEYWKLNHNQDSIYRKKFELK